MKTKAIYRQLGVPPNLQEHMLRVAKIVLYIRNYWTGTAVDWDNLVKAALLHDVGNIVRFKFDSNTEIYGEEAKRLDYWQDRQKEAIAKYGSDDHEATRNMLREIHVDPKIVDWILSKSFANAEEIASTGKWEDKVLLYADMRVLPLGIGSLKERLDEVAKRRKDLADDPTFKNKITACQELEAQIQKNMSVEVSTITDNAIAQFTEDFLEIRI